MQYRKSRYLVSVALSVANPLGSLRVLEKGQGCHSERVNSSIRVAARRQRRISRPKRDPSLNFRRNAPHEKNPLRVTIATFAVLPKNDPFALMVRELDGLETHADAIDGTLTMFDRLIFRG